jgi:hypothetical protein
MPTEPWTVIQITEFIDKYERNLRECVERIPKEYLKMAATRRMFWKTSGEMEDFCFVICITCVNRLTVRKNNIGVIFPNEGCINMSTTVATGDSSFSLRTWSSESVVNHTDHKAGPSSCLAQCEYGIFIFRPTVHLVCLQGAPPFFSFWCQQ